MQGNFSVNRKDLQASNLVGLTRENPVKDPLAVQHLDNLLYMSFYVFCDNSNDDDMAFFP